MGKGGAFAKKAGVIIFPAVIVIWVLSVLPFGVEQYGEASILGRIGTFIAPIYTFSGFATWQASVALFSGIIAKETVVATLGMLYAGVSEGVKLGAIKRESNSLKWTIFAAVGTFLVALIVSTIVYQNFRF